MGKVSSFPEAARWIWLSPEEYPALQETPPTFYAPHRNFDYAAVLFRREFELVEAQNLYALVAGDCRFRIWIDGQYRFDGPPETGGDYGFQDVLPWAFFERRDLPDLMPGKHLITAEVTTWNDLQSDTSMGHGGFRFALFQGEKLLLASDETWECTVDEASASPLRTSWHFNLAQRPWRKAGFVPERYTSRRKLCRYPLPPPAEKTIFPTRVFAPFEPERLTNVEEFLAGRGALVVKRGLPYTFYLEFPGEVAGQMEFHFRNGFGMILKVEPQEILGRGPVEVNCTEELYTKANLDAGYRSRYVRAVHFVRLTVDFAVCGWGGYGDLELKDFVVHARHFPVAEEAAFDCSNAEWNAIRQSCIATLKLCMQTMHWDSPVHQEPLGCIGDYRFEALQSYHLFGEYRLARLDLERIARMLNLTGGKLFHTGFALFYPVMLAEYIRYSGDKTILDEPEIVPAVTAVLDCIGAMRGAEGVISEAPNYMFIDWKLYRDMPLHHPCASGGMAVLSAFYAMALRATQKLAAWSNQPEKAAQYDAEYIALQKTFNQLFFDSKNARYINGIPHLTHVKPNPWLPEDFDETVVTPHSGIAAAAAGLAESDVLEAILPELIRAAYQQEILPYFCNYFFEALAQSPSNAFDTGFALLMERWSEMRAMHPESLRESWVDGDFSHAWSGAPAIWLVRGVLGIEPLEPGFTRCRIAPHRAGLEYASGVMPTPKGPIRVMWRASGKKLILSVEHPADVGCEIETKFLGNPVQVDCRKYV